MNIGTNIDIKSHLLIAGESGSGKSVAMNGLIIETFLDNPQNELYLFDLKLVEFNRYRNLAPIYTTLGQMQVAIDYLHDKMMKRYQKMAKSDSIEWQGAHCYIFIDELGDIITHENKKTAKAITDKIKSIARMGRACGMHLVMATQYPTKEVVPMQIKMNCQKLCLKCNSDMAYRVVMDKKYYDLKGNGDAVYQDYMGNVERFQVNYYSNDVVMGFINEAQKYYQYKN